MADLDTDSVYVKMGMSVVPFLTYEYTHVQVGELVNAHYISGGMIAGEGAGMGSYQTRDATPDVMGTISSLVSASDAGEAGGEMGLNLPTGDLSELSSDMPADAEPVITFDDESGVQTMTLEYTNDSGHDISIVTLIDDSEDLMSYEISTDNGSATTSISYTVMWGDAVIIEVDDTLPRTSIPINFHVEGMPEDNGGDDIFYCDNGNEISRDLVDDGWDDCGDGSDESDDVPDDTFYCDNGNEIPMDWVDDGADDCGDGSDESDGVDVYWHSYYGGYCEWEGNDEDGADETVWWCKNSQDDDYWETWWYYCEHHDSDWHCTDDFGQSEEFEHSAEGDEWSVSDDDGDDGPPTPEEAMAEVDTDGDGYMDYQEFQDAWESDPENPELDYDEVTILFDDCDYDGNDLIDIDEMQCFIDGIVDMLPDGGDEDPEQMFGHIDTDDDGYVSLQDILDFSNEGGDDSDDEIDEEELSDWFSWCDTDEDDLLNLDEFTTCVEDDDGDDGDDEDPEQMMDYMDTDDDGYLSLQELIDFLNNDREQNGEEPMSSEEEEGTANWFYSGDTDGDDLLSLEEFTQLLESSRDDDDNGDDDGDGEGGNDEPSRVTMMVMGQTLNAPISDFEVRFLVDCGEPDEEGNEPPISDCTIAASNGLTEGSATVDPAIAEYEFTYEYLDYDGDGLISDMDTLVIDNLMPGVQVELYDTWADQYTRESFATAEMLPGFGALMALTVLLGAAFATRRD